MEAPGDSGLMSNTTSAHSDSTPEHTSAGPEGDAPATAAGVTETGVTAGDAAQAEAPKPFLRRTWVRATGAAVAAVLLLGIGFAGGLAIGDSNSNDRGHGGWSQGGDGGARPGDGRHSHGDRDAGRMEGRQLGPRGEGGPGGQTRPDSESGSTRPDSRLDRGTRPGQEQRSTPSIPAPGTSPAPGTESGTGAGTDTEVEPGTAG